ncbi:MAG: hypothetical protein JWR90_2540 [Marmoricola sp.]|jgi:hypothetical protein|nr:hypothetical protein [Marmoricola sp.]
MAAFVVLLVAVWGVGFLWVHGDLKRGGDQASAQPAEPSAGASGAASAAPTPVTPTTPAAQPTYTGVVGPAQERKAVDVNPEPARPRPLALPPVAQFKMATFNLLGASHTGGRGKEARKASGASRMSGALALIAQHQVTVVGFQEMQGSQRGAFYARAKGWQLYPGNSLGSGDGENSIGWDGNIWELVKPQTISIPYFNGHVRQMPYILLRDKATGVQAYFANFHNPADTRKFRNQQRFRSEATRREIELFNSLQKTGIPMFATGDMNEREEYFCRVTGSTGLKAAAGGSNSGGCNVPRPTQIDWILGSPDVQFTAYGIDRSALVRRTTDHPVVTASVVVDALKFKNSYAPGAVTVP